MSEPLSNLFDDPRASDSAQRGETFLRLFTRHDRHLLAYIYALLPNDHDANDVFQQTSLILWRKFDEYDGEREFLPWACGVAYYEVRNFLRVAGRSKLRFNDDLLKTLADEHIERGERGDRRRVALDECIKRLDDAQRRLLRQVYAGEHTIEELADQLGRAVQTLYNRLNLLRRKLFECVERRLTEQGDTE